MTYEDWLKGLTSEQRYDFDSEGRGYKKDASVMMRLAWEAGAAAGRKVWMDAVTDEPELPGAMPNAMWDAMRADREAATEAMRIAVRQTKSGILKRGMRSNVELSGGRRPSA